MDQAQFSKNSNTNTIFAILGFAFFLILGGTYFYIRFFINYDEINYPQNVYPIIAESAKQKDASLNDQASTTMVKDKNLSIEVEKKIKQIIDDNKTVKDFTAREKAQENIMKEINKLILYQVKGVTSTNIDIASAGIYKTAISDNNLKK